MQTLTAISYAFVFVLSPDKDLTMIRLPRLMLGSNLSQLLALAVEVEDDEAGVVEIDAADLITAERIALCVVASVLSRLERRGQSSSKRESRTNGRARPLAAGCGD